MLKVETKFKTKSKIGIAYLYFTVLEAFLTILKLVDSCLHVAQIGIKNDFKLAQA